MSELDYNERFLLDKLTAGIAARNFHNDVLNLGRFIVLKDAIWVLIFGGNTKGWNYRWVGRWDLSTSEDYVNCVSWSQWLGQTKKFESLKTQPQSLTFLSAWHLTCYLFSNPVKLLIQNLHDCTFDECRILNHPYIRDRPKYQWSSDSYQKTRFSWKLLRDDNAFNGKIKNCNFFTTSLTFWVHQRESKIIWFENYKKKNTKNERAQSSNRSKVIVKSYSKGESCLSKNFKHSSLWDLV